MGNIVKFGSDVTRIADALEMMARNQSTDVSKMSWGRIASLVHEGKGPAYFPLGTELNVAKGSSNLIFEVVHHGKLADSNGDLLPHMVLFEKYGPDAVQFDNYEAVYYAENGLAAGTYHLTVPSNDGNYISGKSYQFTLTKAVPKGGQIAGWERTLWDADKTPLNTKLFTFSSSSSTTPIETVQATEGTGGTMLGNISSKAVSTYPLVNSVQRFSYGSNNYAQSAMRQWLNSNGTAGTFWKPTNKFDRPPVWVSSMAGFLNGVDSDFINVLAKIPRIYPTNTVFETSDYAMGSSYKLADKIFLASRTEIYGDKENNIADGIGVQFGRFVGSGNTDKIKLDRYNGSTQYWWLSTPYTGDAVHVRRVSVDGSMGTSDAGGSIRAVAACII